MRTRFNPKAIEQMNEFDRYIKDKETIQKIISNNKEKKIYLIQIKRFVLRLVWEKVIL